MKLLLTTYATGIVGRALTDATSKTNQYISALLRSQSAFLPAEVK